MLLYLPIKLPVSLSQLKQRTCVHDASFAICMCWNDQRVHHNPRWKFRSYTGERQSKSQPSVNNSFYKEHWQHPSIQTIRNPMGVQRNPQRPINLRSIFTVVYSLRFVVHFKTMQRRNGKLMIVKKKIIQQNPVQNIPCRCSQPLSLDEKMPISSVSDPYEECIANWTILWFTEMWTANRVT